MTAGLLWGHDLLMTGELGLRGSLAVLACGDGRRVGLGLMQDIATSTFRGARGRARKLTLCSLTVCNGKYAIPISPACSGLGEIAPITSSRANGVEPCILGTVPTRG